VVTSVYDRVERVQRVGRCHKDRLHLRFISPHVGQRLPQRRPSLQEGVLQDRNVRSGDTERPGSLHLPNLLPGDHEQRVPASHPRPRVQEGPELGRRPPPVVWTPPGRNSALIGMLKCVTS